MPTQRAVDAVVVGGGPAGAAVARLLADWGHSAIVLARGGPPSRGLAESLPPSTVKLLARIGVLGAVERAGFYRSRGNTVWWGRSSRSEPFAAGRDGFQVFRPDFDRVLIDGAAAAGADVRLGASVRDVTFDGRGASVAYEAGGLQTRIACRYVIDCSGRAGVVGRRFRLHEPGRRTYALVGVWHHTAPWPLDDQTHTVVETCSDGWTWSVPIDPSTRHVGAMIAAASFAGPRLGTLANTYLSELAKAPHTARLVARAALKSVWACDASLYSSSTYAGPRFLLVGDAGSFIDPLSSFGVKKALASAWLGAVAVHTALTRPADAAMAMQFFSDWEARVYAAHLRSSAEFARAAFDEHETAFWRDRSIAPVGAPPDDDAMLGRDPGVRRAFERFKTLPELDLVAAENVRTEPRPMVRGREIVLEPALATPSGGMRYVANVDLVKLAQIAVRHRQMPDLFAAYCRECAPVPLPNVVGGLSLLVARGILHERT